MEVTRIKTVSHSYNEFKFEFFLWDSLFRDAIFFLPITTYSYTSFIRRNETMRYVLEFSFSHTHAYIHTLHDALLAILSFWFGIFLLGRGDVIHDGTRAVSLALVIYTFGAVFFLPSPSSGVVFVEKHLSHWHVSGNEKVGRKVTRNEVNTDRSCYIPIVSFYC